MEPICVFHFLDLVLLDRVTRGLTVGYQLIYNNRVLPAITAYLLFSTAGCQKLTQN